MELQKIFLRIMLWSLGVTAGLGVLAILVSSNDLVWRVVGTGAVTAVASGLLIPTSRMIDLKKTRTAGLLGMSAIILEFSAGVLLIWEVVQLWFSVSVAEDVGLTMVFFGLMVAAVMIFLRLTHTQRLSHTGRWGAVVSIAVFVVILPAIWLPGGPTANDEWWQTAGAISLYGFLGVINLVDGAAAGRKKWNLLGVTAAVIAGAMWLADIWAHRGSPTGTVIFASLTCITAVVGYVFLLSLCVLRDEQRWLRWCTIGAAVLTAAMLDLLVVYDQLLDWSGPIEDMTARVAGAGGILTCCGTLAMLVLTRLNRRMEWEPVSVEATAVTLQCPRCGKKQNLPLGEASCEKCRLRFHIHIEEPRCPKCEYLLYGLSSNRCPECGTAIS